MPEYGSITQHRRPQTPPPQRHSACQRQDSSAAGGRQPTYTSFASLGAAEPQSPSDDQRAGASSSRSAIRASWRIVKSFASTLDPRPTDERLDEMGDGLIVGDDAADEETTPLLRGARRNVLTRSQKYVGGGCVCDPFEADVVAAQLATAGDGDGGVAILEEGPCQGCITLSGSRAERARSKNSRWPSGITLAAVSQVCYASLSMLCALLGDDPLLTHANRIDAFHVLFWHSVVLTIVALLVLLAVRRTDILFGPRTARAWHWSRALCCAITSITFVLASQRMAMCNLVAVVFVAPTTYTIGSQLFFTSRNPFRAQVAAISLWIGLVLLVGPQLATVQPSKPTSEDATVAASPVDMPPLVSIAMDVSFRWAYACAAICTLSSFLTFALLDRRPTGRQFSPYHTIFASSLLTAVLIAVVHVPIIGSSKSTHSFYIIPRPSSLKGSLVTVSALLFSLLARLLQEVSVTRTTVCQIALIAFLQPLISTGLDVLLDNDLDIGDVIPIAGCLLVAVNLIWITSPLDDDEPLG